VRPFGCADDGYPAPTGEVTPEQQQRAEDFARSSGEAAGLWAQELAARVIRDTEPAPPIRDHGWVKAQRGDGATTTTFCRYCGVVCGLAAEDCPSERAPVRASTVQVDVPPVVYPRIGPNLGDRVRTESGVVGLVVAVHLDGRLLVSNENENNAHEYWFSRDEIAMMLSPALPQ
jgi:hypothetical protein